MAKLDAAERKRLPAKDFAGPHRSFPVEDKAHARDALARAADKPPAERARIDAKADRVLGEKGGKKDPPLRKHAGSAWHDHDGPMPEHVDKRSGDV